MAAGIDEWVHAGCVLWSEGVLASKDGHLKNVSQIIDKSTSNVSSGTHVMAIEIPCYPLVDLRSLQQEQSVRDVLQLLQVLPSSLRLSGRLPLLLGQKYGVHRTLHGLGRRGGQLLHF